MGFFSNKLASYRAAASALFFMQGIIFSTWTTRIADIRTALNLTEADLGNILFGLPLGQLITMPFSGYLVSKITSKRCIYVGTILYPSCLLLINAAESLQELFACLVLFGIAANINNIAINTQAVSVQHLYGRSIMGAMHGTWSLACFCGGWLTMLFMKMGIGVGGHFIFTICYSFASLAIFGPMLLAEDIDGSTGKPEGAAKKRFSPTPFILLLGLTAFGSMSCEGTMFNWSVIYFRDVVKVPDSISGIGYIAFMSMMACGRFASDFFVNRFGMVRVLQCSGIIIISGMMLAVLLPEASTATIGFLLVGAGVSSVVPICYSAAGKSRRMPAGIAIATVAGIGFLGFLMGPPLIGHIAHASSLRISFATMACIGLIVTLIAPFLRFRLGKN